MAPRVTVSATGPRVSSSPASGAATFGGAGGGQKPNLRLTTTATQGALAGAASPRATRPQPTTPGGAVLNFPGKPKKAQLQHLSPEEAANAENRAQRAAEAEKETAKKEENQYEYFLNGFNVHGVGFVNMQSGAGDWEPEDNLDLNKATPDDLLEAIRKVLLRVRKEEWHEQKRNCTQLQLQKHSQKVKRLLKGDYLSEEIREEIPKLKSKYPHAAKKLMPEVFPTYKHIHSPLNKRTEESPTNKNDPRYKSEASRSSDRRLIDDGERLTEDQKHKFAETLQGQQDQDTIVDLNEEDCRHLGFDMHVVSTVDEQTGKTVWNTDGKPTQRATGITQFEENVMHICRELMDMIYQEPNTSGGFFGRQSCSHCGRLLLSTRTKFQPQERCNVCTNATIRFGEHHPSKYHSQARLDRLVDHKMQMDIGRTKIYGHSVTDIKSAIKQVMSTDKVNNAKKEMMHLMTMRVNRYHIPSVDLHDSLQKVIDAVVDRLWEYFGGGDRLDMQARLERMQDTMEKQTHMFLKEVDWYRSQGLAQVPWFEGAKSGECLNFFPAEEAKEGTEGTMETPFTWFYEPLEAFSEDKQECMKYLIDHCVYRILTRASGKVDQSVQTDPNCVDAETQTIDEESDDGELDRVKQALNDTVEKMQALQQELQNCQEEKAQFEERIEELKEELSAAGDQLKSMEEADSDAMKMQMKLAGAEQQLLESEAKNEALEAKLAAEKVKVEELEQAMAEMDVAPGSLPLRRVSSVKGMPEDELAALQEQWKAEMEREREEERKKWQEERDAERKELEAGKEGLHDQFKTLEKSLEETEKKLEKYKVDAAKCEELQLEILKKDSTIDKITSTILELKETCKRQQEQIEELTKALNSGGKHDHLAALKAFLTVYSSRPVFERLYVDASERRSRCEKRRAEGLVDSMEQFLELLRSELLNIGGIVKTSRTSLERVDSGVDEVGRPPSVSRRQPQTMSHMNTNGEVEGEEDDASSKEFLAGPNGSKTFEVVPTNRSTAQKKSLQTMSRQKSFHSGNSLHSQKSFKSTRSRGNVGDATGTGSFFERRTMIHEEIDDLVKLKYEKIEEEKKPATSLKEMASRAFMKHREKKNYPTLISQGTMQDLMEEKTTGEKKGKRISIIKDDSGGERNSRVSVAGIYWTQNQKQSGDLQPMVWTSPKTSRPSNSHNLGGQKVTTVVGDEIQSKLVWDNGNNKTVQRGPSPSDGPGPGDLPKESNKHSLPREDGKLNVSKLTDNATHPSINLDADPEYSLVQGDPVKLGTLDLTGASINNTSLSHSDGVVSFGEHHSVHGNIAVNNNSIGPDGTGASIASGSITADMGADVVLPDANPVQAVIVGKTPKNQHKELNMEFPDSALRPMHPESPTQKSPQHKSQRSPQHKSNRHANSSNASSRTGSPEKPGGSKSRFMPPKDEDFTANTFVQSWLGQGSQPSLTASKGASGLGASGLEASGLEPKRVVLPTVAMRNAGLLNNDTNVFTSENLTLPGLGFKPGQPVPITEKGLPVPDPMNPDKVKIQKRAKTADRNRPGTQQDPGSRTGTAANSGEYGSQLNKNSTGGASRAKLNQLVNTTGMRGEVEEADFSKWYFTRPSTRG